MNQVKPAGGQQPAAAAGQRPQVAAPATAGAAPAPDKRPGPGRPPLTEEEKQRRAGTPAAPGAPAAGQPTPAVKQPAAPEQEPKGPPAWLLKKYETAGGRMAEINLAWLTAMKIFLGGEWKAPTPEERTQFQEAWRARCQERDRREVSGLYWIVSLHFTFIVARVEDLDKALEKLSTWFKKIGSWFTRKEPKGAADSQQPGGGHDGKREKPAG